MKTQQIGKVYNPSKRQKTVNVTAAILVIGGAAIGAYVGLKIGGPIGAAVGALVGAFVGALAACIVTKFKARLCRDGSVEVEYETIFA